MENEETAIDLKKQIVDWEAQCEQLKVEKVALEEEMLKLKGKEEKLEEKYLRRKEKHAELEKKFETEEKKWREDEEKIRERCRQLEVDKRKLEIDLREAVGSIGDGSDEVMDKHKAEVELLRSLLEESRGRIITLLAKNESLESHNSKIAMETNKLKVVEERQEASVEAEETTLSEAEGTKVQELVQRIKVLERVNSNMSDDVRRINQILAESIAMKENHEKKVLELISVMGVLEKEKQRLEAANKEKDEKIKVLLQEREQFPVKKRKMETTRNVVKSENGVESSQQVHPSINVGTFGNLTAQYEGGGRQRTTQR